MLWILPFSYFQRNLKTIPEEYSQRDEEFINRVRWAVMVARQYIPMATCLTQALTAYQQLNKRNYPSTVKIGVVKGNEGEFEAHAWLEIDDRIIIGESEKEYVNLLDLN